MNWKKALYSGLGGAVVGAFAVVAYKRRKAVCPAQSLTIPPGDALVVRTEEREVPYRDSTYLSSGTYTCVPTQFYVPSLLSVSVPGRNDVSTQLVYYVTPEIIYRLPDQPGEREAFQGEKFYATIYLYPGAGQRSLPDQIAVGCYLEFHRCHVGASPNGVETGERITTLAPVASFKVKTTAELS
jgi:hypothetical protein